MKRALSLVCALVPVAGAAFFGWSLATVVFMIWLDTWLYSLRVIPACMEDLEPDAVHPVRRFYLKLLFGVIFWLIASSPLFYVGIVFDNLVRQIGAGGFRTEAYDLFFDQPWWLAIIVGGRLLQSARDFAAARAQGKQRFTAVLKAQFLVGLGKCVVLLPLAWFAPLFGNAGFWGVLAFAALASATIVASEWYAEHRLAPRPAAAKKPLNVVHGFTNLK